MSDLIQIDPDDIEDFVEDLIEEKLKYYKIYEGVVRNNADPENSGRIQVEIHELAWSTPDLWAWAEPEFALRGGWVIPAVGDEVKLYFQGGDVNNLVYRGYMYYENPAPETLFSKGIIFKTNEKEIQLTYDDAQGSLEIIVDTDYKISIDTEDGINITDSINTIKLKEGIEVVNEDNNIKLNTSGLELTDGINSIKLKKSGGIEITDGTSSIKFAATGITLDDSVDQIIMSNLPAAAGGIQLVTGDTTPWVPNSFLVDPFTGLPHGGLAAGILRLKGG